MDRTRLRAQLIEQNELENMDDVYTFYYDESNNIRKLYLKDCGLNVPRDKNFVLAGILHKGLQHEVSYSQLFSDLGLQKTTTELKFKHVAKGSFPEALKSIRLRMILNWLIDNQFYVHYFNLNIVYWSIVDILDSIIGELRHPFYIEHHLQIKGDFYLLVRENQRHFLSVLESFNYPDINPIKKGEFCRWLIDFIKVNSNHLPSFNAEVLKALTKESLTLDDLPFVTGFHGKELIDNFMVFYARNLFMFCNSKHIFDEESHVEREINALSMTVNGKPIDNYEFVKSKDVRAIQLSDVIAGLLGKYFTYLKDTSIEQLKLAKDSLNTQQIETLSLLKQLVDMSDDLSSGFFHVVSSQDEREKHDAFFLGLKYRMVGS